MARSSRRAAFEAEHGKPSKSEAQLVISSSGASDALIDFVDNSEAFSAQPQQSDTEPRIIEPEIRIEGTKIGTRGGNLASTALQNIMDSFNAASRKNGVDTIGEAVFDDRFSTEYGGRSASLPHIVGDFMDGKAIPASLSEKDPLDPTKPPKHDKDLDILNNSDVKRAEGWDEGMIAADKDELKDWLLKNYGAGAVQKIGYPYSTVDHKVTNKDRKQLVSHIRRLEKEAKLIATGKIPSFAPAPPNDEEPTSEEDRDIADQYEREGEKP